MTKFLVILRHSGTALQLGNHLIKISTTIVFCHVRLFEQRCIALMDSMYNENTRHAMDLMDDEAVVWGIRSSPLTFAHENFMYEIVAHTCSQKNMNKLWYNNLPPDLKPFLKVDSLTQLIIDLCLLGT